VNREVTTWIFSWSSLNYMSPNSSMQQTKLMDKPHHRRRHWSWRNEKKKDKI